MYASTLAVALCVQVWDEKEVGLCKRKSKNKNKKLKETLGVVGFIFPFNEGEEKKKFFVFAFTCVRRTRLQ
ncbi:hypothetical protein TRSC58_07661 [Trypanosoma rangeli SC58]|uniref:Uncharacterized protein n=1 Tax=Trypanosoma rangeli SC58 TaxID=429131 RepID=A0A061IRI6_TRYRA|nr:hypothetical protein TRSC58_07661 [Trypanosoma rangeli SC58]